MSSGIPHDWFVCPVTKQPLVFTEGALRSSGGYVYHRNKEFSFWDFTPHTLPDPGEGMWTMWEHLQRNGIASYENDPEHNLGVGKRKDYLEFAKFCRFRGTILDVGVGPQACPTHIQAAGGDGVSFVGIDPLIGSQPREFEFVQGLGEYLPFRDELFDQVLFVTTLDHLVDPRGALSEARRVSKGDGDILVWLGHKRKDAPAPAASPPWYNTLCVPHGAEDIFHRKRLSPEEAEEFWSDCGLHVAEKSVRQIDTWRTNFFYRLRKD
jgi:SAM-dependent methyltransferase